MLTTIALSAVSFVSTNLDDLFLNTLFFSQAQTKQQSRRVVLGKYLGIGTLTLFGILGALGLRALPPLIPALLGLVPIFLGIRELFRGKEDTDSAEIRDTAPTVWNTALITVANGGDNVGIYVPLFAGFSLGQMTAAVLVFAVLTYLWCLLAQKLAALPVLREFLTKYRRILLPLVYIGLGVHILAQYFLQFF